MSGQKNGKAPIYALKYLLTEFTAAAWIREGQNSLRRRRQSTMGRNLERRLSSELVSSDWMDGLTPVSD